MDVYEQMVTRQRKWMLSLLVIFVLGAAVTPYKRIFLGLLLGGVVSYYSLRLLQGRVRRFGETAIGGKRAIGFGTLFRMAGALLAVIIALRFEDKFHIIAVALGLATSYIVMLIDSVLWSIADDENQD